ncbi:MAG: quinol:cytochrome C oxidoreductase [Bacteroidota bacterium]
MASYSNKFVQPEGMKKWGIALSAIGALTLIAGIFFLAFSEDEHSVTRFWAVLLQNSTYFLLVVNAAMFFLCATTLAWAGFTVSFRRVTEAISTLVPIFGVLAFIVLMALVYGHQHHIYHWLTPEGDKVLEGKSGFLNPTFFTIWTVITIAGWSYLGHNMRKISREADENPMSVEEGKKWIFKNTVNAAFYIVLFALTVASSIPWLWLMSVDAHWYSTMYSWYTFASTFVAGMALIALFIIYLKNQGHLPYTNEEHLHDVGKFMFAFSIFWTYLWFSQFMLIWYANIPEETKYFRSRMLGEYRGLFWLNLILNFVTPFLILMKAGAKRNYSIVTFAAIIIIFGHWLDFFLMVMPGPLGDHATISWFELGIAAGYVGMIVFLVGRALEKAPLVPLHHPFLKESIIHHT